MLDQVWIQVQVVGKHYCTCQLLEFAGIKVVHACMYGSTLRMYVHICVYSSCLHNQSRALS